MWRIAVVAGLLGALLPAGEKPKPRQDPRIRSIYPLTGQAGTTWRATVRGTALKGARLVVFGESSTIAARVMEVGTPQQEQGAPPPSDTVMIEISAQSGARGEVSFRLVADAGVSNALKLRVADRSVISETQAAQTLTKFPVLINGQIAQRGEVDTIWFDAQPGQSLSFSAASGNATFDPSLAIVEPSGSWFDSGRVNRLAFNDEPLHFPGLANDAYLTYRFEKAGRYGIQVQAFSGQGSPDYAYQLTIDPGTIPNPALHPAQQAPWDERMFTRAISEQWMDLIALRGGGERAHTSAPIVQATSDPLSSPRATVPSMIEGRIASAAELHRVRLQIDKPQDLAIEIETPEATLPRFNPVVRLLAPDGSEIVTNVYTKRNNNGLYMMKMIQAKSTFSLRSAGEYMLEIRDITTDVAGKDFAYRVLVRPQIPHAGRIDVTEDFINLEPSEAKPLTVKVDREEGFSSLIAVSAEGLPPGVTAVVGMANPVEKPPLPNGGRLERYTAKPQIASLMLIAGPDAPLTDAPVAVRIVAHSINSGRPEARIVVKEIPLMVIVRRPS